VPWNAVFVPVADKKEKEKTQGHLPTCRFFFHSGRVYFWL
jgi:hypothetical protein